MATIKNVNKQIAKGSIWMVLFKLIEKSISIISTIILARLLSPEDFGLVAIALIVASFLELLRAFNFDMVLIQNQKATREHYDTAWTFNIITTTFVALLLIALAPLATNFYDDTRLYDIFLVLSFGIFISGFENIGTVAFRKELTFHKEFVYLLGKKLIGFIIGISLALYYKNYWALIGGTIATYIGVVILSFAIHKYRPSFCLKKAKELFSFSGWLLLNNTLNFLNYRMPEAIIGKFSGTTALGFFSLSTDITKLTSTEIVLPINRAAFPGYSKLNQDYIALKDSFLNTLGMIAILTFPASLGFSAIAPIMVPILLGDKWIETIVIMQLLAISGLVGSISAIQMIYLAIGKPQIMTRIFLIKFIVTTPIFIFMLYEYQLAGAIVGLIISSILMLPINFYPIQKELKIKTGELISKFLRPALAATIMFITLTIVINTQIINDQHQYSFISLILNVLLGAFMYVISMLILWKMAKYPNGSEQQILTILKEQLSKHYKRIKNIN